MNNIERYGTDIMHIFQGILHLFPTNKTITLLMNDLDEPRILPLDPDVSDEPNYDWELTYYTHPSQVIPHSTCLRTKYKNELERHGFFTSPSSWITTPTLLPVFTPCSTSHCFKDIIFPFRSENMPSLRRKQLMNVTDTWSGKQNVLMWRGSTTGAHIVDQEYMESLSERHHRFSLVSWAMRRNQSSLAKHIDVAFSAVTQCDVNSCDGYLRQKYRFTDRMSRQRQYKYKYVGMLDGNSWPSRFQGFLLEARQLVFLNALFEDWFSMRLKPWKHYLPFSIDPEVDLEARLKWALDNDSKAKEIADQGYLYAKRSLRTEDMKCYAALLIMEYANLIVDN
jgi:hypothetical protein